MPGVKSRIAIVVCFLLLAVTSAGQNWPRAPRAGGRSRVRRSEASGRVGTSQNIAWQIEVPGRSWSSPVVWDDHVFVITAINTNEAEKLLPVSAYVARSGGGPMTFQDISKPSAPYRWVLYDIDFKRGQIRWTREVAKAAGSIDTSQNSYASETPVTDGERVYVYLGHLGLFAFDLQELCNGRSRCALSRCRPEWERQSPRSWTTRASTS